MKNLNLSFFHRLARIATISFTTTANILPIGANMAENLVSRLTVGALWLVFFFYFKHI
jgi:hypothetical protein